LELFYEEATGDKDEGRSAFARYPILAFPQAFRKLAMVLMVKLQLISLLTSP
jgi:hypothetical protein